MTERQVAQKVFTLPSEHGSLLSPASSFKEGLRTPCSLGLSGFILTKNASAFAMSLLCVQDSTSQKIKIF